MRKLTNNDFIEKCKLIHGDRFSYHKTNYINVRTKVTVTCDKHGNFDILPTNHLNGQGCVKCARESHKLTQLSMERLENINKIHNYKYLYPDLSINNGKVKIVCKDHGEFEQSIYNHERGHGCNKCVRSLKVKSKICKVCNIEKTKSEFYANYKRCKKCVDDDISPIVKVCVKCGEEKDSNLFYRHNSSIDRYRNDCIDCFNSYGISKRKIYRQKNKSSIRKKDLIYRKDRMKSDPFYRSKIDARNIIRKAISTSGYSKKSKTESILGCSYLDFKNHIESLFLPRMNWENRNLWHIDHIVPLSFAQNEDELLLINHFTNLRPIWIEHNQLKSDKIEIKNEIYEKIVNLRLLTD